MQEEVENRTVNLVITSTKLTARTLATALKKIKAHYDVSASKRKAKKAAEKNQKPTGKQTVQELIGQNQGAQTIDIAATDIKGFERYAHKYGVDYAIKKDITEKPPKYLVFFKARDADVLTQALKEYTSASLGVNHRSKESILKELGKYKTLVASLPRKVKDKVQEIGR